MKRRIGILVLIGILLLTGCTVIENDPYLTIPTNREGTLVVYTLERETYYQFLEAPSFEQLQKNHGESLSLYTVASDNVDVIEIQSHSRGKNRTHRIENGTMWMHNIRLCRELITFGGSVQTVEAFLQQNGIQDAISEYCLVNSEYFPVALWVNTTGGHYFITFNEYAEDYEQYSEDGTFRRDYVYRLYTYEQFLKNVMPIEGTIGVEDGSVVSTVIHRDYAEIPLFTLARMLGATVQKRWNSEWRLTLQDCAVTVNTKKDTYNGESFVQPGWHGMLSYRDDEYYVDSVSADRVLAVWGLTLDIDREQGVVRVNAK